MCLILLLPWIVLNAYDLYLVLSPSERFQALIKIVGQIPGIELVKDAPVVMLLGELLAKLLPGGNDMFCSEVQAH